MAISTPRHMPVARAAQRDRELLLDLLIEYHGLVIAFRTAKPKSPEYQQLVRREELIQQRIREITAAESAGAPPPRG